jgi:hypothetical protein
MPEYTYYKIVSKDENIKDCYIGKTLDFKKRVGDHKNNCNNENYKHYNYKVYLYIRENGGINNFNFIEIEKGEYNNEESALKERELIEKFNANLNIQIPSRTKKEYEESENRKKSKKEGLKEFRQKNREILNKKARDIYEKNKEKFKEKAKEYYDKNVEIISEKNKEKIMCECGCEIVKRYLSTHLKTKKHIDLMI